MRPGISLQVTASDSEPLRAIVDERNSPQKRVWRAKIVLLTADSRGTTEIRRQAGVAKRAVWRWQERFLHADVDGLPLDWTRQLRIPPLNAGIVARMVQMTLSDPPAAATHRTAPAIAKASGIGGRSVQRIWRSHGPQPNRVRRFRLSNDPRLVEKVRDIVGLHVDPPANAVVLSIDEKSQIQALDRPQPGLPLKHGRCGIMTHSYIRNGTTTLFAALDVAVGKVIGRAMPRHRHQEFIRFLNAVEADLPAGKLVHAIVSNDAVHKHPKVLRWLAGTRAGPSTSLRPTHLCSMPSRACSSS